MSKMILHCNAVEASYEDLKKVVSPENHERFKDKSATYGTVPHHRLVDAVRSMARHCFGKNCIDRETFGLSQGDIYPGARFFALFRLNFDVGSEKAIAEAKVEEVKELSDEEEIAKIADLDNYQPSEEGGDNPPRMIVPADREFPASFNVMEDDRIFPALAIRNAHDRSMAISAALGHDCFICDNLSLSGDVMFSRKHTRNALEDVMLTFWGLLQTMREQFAFDEEYRQQAKLNEISHDRGFEILGRLAGMNVLSFEGGNKSQLALAMNEWRKPRYEIFEGRNLWSLHNSVTFAQRKTGIGRRLEAGSNATNIFRDMLDEVEMGTRWANKAAQISAKYRNPTKATILDLLDVIQAMGVEQSTEVKA